MKQYYYLAGSTQLGPFMLDELRTKGITRDTLVWSAGMTDWLKAGDVAELNSLFMGGMSTLIDPVPPMQSQPVQQPNPSYQQPTPSYQQSGMGGPYAANAYAAGKPKNWLVESILATILCCMPFGIAGIVSAARVDAFYNSGDISSAQRASAEAGKWTKVSFFVAIGGWVLYLLFFGAAFMAAFNSSRYRY